MTNDVHQNEPSSPMRPVLVVLCVIQDEDLSSTVTRVLRGMSDHRVTTFAARGLAAARALLTRTRFDAMVLSSELMDEPAEAASQGEASAAGFIAELASKVPVIVVGPRGTERQMHDALRAGARDSVLVDDHLTLSLTRALRAVVDLSSARPPRSRGRARAVHGRTIGFVGAQGGVGTTTALLNCTSVLARERRSVIAAELTGWTSAFSAQLRQTPHETLAELLSSPEPIGIVGDRYLTAGPTGARLLYGPAVPRPSCPEDSAQLDRLVLDLMHQAEIVLVDLPTTLPESVRSAVRHMDHIVVVMGPFSSSLPSAKATIARLEDWGVGYARMSALIVRGDDESTEIVRPEVLMRELPVRLAATIPSAAGPCAQACERGLPVVACNPDLPVSKAFHALADELVASIGHQRLKVVVVNADGPLSDSVVRLLEESGAVRFDLFRSPLLIDVLADVARGSYDAVLLAPRGSGEDVQRDLVRVTTLCDHTAAIVLERSPAAAAVRAYLLAGAQEVVDLEHIDGYWMAHSLVCAIDRQRLVHQIQTKARELETCELSHRRLITRILRGTQPDPRMV